MRVLATLFVCILWLCLTDRGDGGRASTWDYCECYWGTWKSWSDCTSTCFGTRKRHRSVWLTEHEGCSEFSDCASNDEGLGWESQACNDVCHNGGTPISLGFFDTCKCQPAYEGICCKDRVTCGSLDSVANGDISYPNTYYGATATYSCRQYYQLTDGSTYRTCQSDSVWSGTKPRCAYVNHCASQPCKNGAQCTDLLDDYKCTCKSGWSGRHCENDIQPPVMSGCLADQTVHATTRNLPFNWTEPTFVDPFGNDVKVTSNYKSPQFTFPWGDFTVQYVATKPSNGLQTECMFQIRVRPTPCDDINIPINGARLCNGWKTDYGRFCLVACHSTYTIDAAWYSYEKLHVCGASGSWTPSGPLPDCEIHMSDVGDILTYQPSYPVFSYNSTCSDPVTKRGLQDLFISKLSASFQEFCTSFADECVPENVQVDCGPKGSGDFL